MEIGIVHIDLLFLPNQKGMFKHNHLHSHKNNMKKHNFSMRAQNYTISMDLYMISKLML